MAVLFPKTHGVIRRGQGAYVNGVWTPGGEPAVEILLANIQPASSGDYARLQAVAAGRRISAMMRCFTDLDANLKVAGDDHPGDIVVYNGQRWLVIGSARWDSLDDADTSHCRYMLALEAEHAAGEVMA